MGVGVGVGVGVDVGAIREITQSSWVWVWAWVWAWAWVWVWVQYRRMMLACFLFFLGAFNFVPILLHADRRAFNPTVLANACLQVPSSVVLNIDPGDIFTHRNVGNLFCNNDFNALTGKGGTPLTHTPECLLTGLVLAAHRHTLCTRS